MSAKTTSIGLHTAFAKLLLLFLFASKIFTSASAIQAKPHGGTISSMNKTHTYQDIVVDCFTPEQIKPPYINDSHCITVLSYMVRNLGPLFEDRVFSSKKPTPAGAFGIPQGWEYRSCWITIDTRAAENEDVFRLADVIHGARGIIKQCLTPPSKAPLGGESLLGPEEKFFVTIDNKNELQKNFGWRTGPV